MKLLTLNTHSLLEKNYLQKLDQFVDTILKEQPDILSLQEVNQSITAPLAGKGLLRGWHPCRFQDVSSIGTSVSVRGETHGYSTADGDNVPSASVCRETQEGQGSIPIREDNHAAQVASRLWQAGIPCSWTWVPAKIGYDKYDEGLAFLCLNREIRTAESIFISNCRDYGNWKTRKALGIQVEGLSDWFYAIHMGWWQDEEEPFAQQWLRLQSALRHKKQESAVWLMGDFNSPAGFRAQGYDCIQNAGWLDTYCLAEKKDSGITVEGCIDGWRPVQKPAPQEPQEPQEIQQKSAPQELQELQEEQQKPTSPETQNAQQIIEAQGLQKQKECKESPDGMRMDHIWCSRKVQIKNSQVLFNGKNGGIVSDHYGVLVEAVI